jgi:hypothetical protein
MSASFRNAQETHSQSQLRLYYERLSQNPREVVIYDERFVPTRYTRYQHYLPHGIGLGGIVLTGAILLSIYNNNIKETFESAYFSSW